MKITAEKFFSRNFFSFNSCLIYGDNTGKVQDYFSTVVNLGGFKLNDPFCSTTLPFKDIAYNHQLLLDKVNTLSFKGDKRLIHIADIEQTLPISLQKIFDNMDYGSTYVILTSKKNLPVNSSTRNYFETSNNYAVIACYHDEGEGLKTLIRAFLSDNGIVFCGSIIDALSYCLRGERANIYSELEKLVIYLGEEKTLTEEDVINCCVNDFQLYAEDISFAFAEKDSKKFLSLINVHSNLLFVIKVIVNYFLRLNQVLLILKEGRSLQSALSSLKPQIFFKHINCFKYHLKLWSVKEIIVLLNKLLEIEIFYKKGEVKSAKMLFEKLVFMI
ncbi:MAG: hypothetical protein HRK26_05380 [Rickettsiaceae bacterium H1]|nr:hypothetical protein [Rickettsiaceae bacterium H1]